jgi:hypothetical protein
MLLKRLSERGEPGALSDSAAQVFIELISFLLVLVEEEGLEGDGGDKQKLADECE